jgi:hypothetical protein
VIGQSIALIYCQSEFLGVSHYGAPHKKINTQGPKTLWEIMLAMNQNETTALEFRETVRDFLEREYYELQIQMPDEPIIYANWEYTYRFVRTRPQIFMTEQDRFQNIDTWQGTILIQAVDQNLSQWIAAKGIGTMLYRVPSLSIPIEEHWSHQTIENALPENQQGNTDEDNNDKPDQ